VQVAITCRHGSVSDSLRDYIAEKSEKLLTYFERVTAIQVTIDQGQNQNRVEILVDAEHKHNLFPMLKEMKSNQTFTPH